mmetsp:Transcript_30084/g.66649  ORF Transcript_30084/g.66649 Transcript_30084/m.66649 type:complete len:219 (+) Transcript_30084:3-659(+)
MQGAGGSSDSTPRVQRTGPGMPLEQFTPTRGLIYSVFAELDKFGAGKLTYSEFEDAAVVVGIRRDNAKRFFQTMDRDSRGYITVQDWGDRRFEKQLAQFTRLYVQKTRGATGRHKDVREVGNLYAALQMALTKLKLKNNGRSVSHERLLEAFEFIDADKSGALSPIELLDAFHGMGIYVTPQVVREAMETFDRDKNGMIDYGEFIGTLFPTLSKGYRI